MQILFIDDEREAVRHYVTFLVEEAGHDVVLLHTVSSALEELDKPGFPYDLVIFDVGIRLTEGEVQLVDDPALAGLTLYDRFRKRYHSIPALILTNFSHEAVRRLADSTDRLVTVLDKVDTLPSRLAREVDRKTSPHGSTRR